jgi:hypothetical protein
MNVTIEQHLHGVWGNGFYTNFGVFDDRGAGACTKSKTRTLARYTERALYYRKDCIL